MAEQTWPTDEEIAAGMEFPDFFSPVCELIGSLIAQSSMPGDRPRKKRRVPAGTSAYQAAWIVDSEDDEQECTQSEDDSSDLDGNASMTDAVPTHEEVATEEAVSNDTDDRLSEDSGYEDSTDVCSTADMELDEVDHEAMVERRRRRHQENEEDLDFPDQVEVPLDQPARVRFAR